MAASIPVRIDNDIYASAKAAAPSMDRSAAQQISHWARIGRELEKSRSITHNEIAAVLGGDSHYDDLDARSQAVVRAAWADQMQQRREALNIEAEFVAEGRPYAELDESEQIVVRAPNETTAESTG
ncbi:MAG: hypothetical protein OXG91_06530 [bacterium]|nr:hypothetical protein [bacterium]